VDQTETLCEKHDPSQMICEYADILFQAGWIDTFDDSLFENYYKDNVREAKDIFGMSNMSGNLPIFFIKRHG